MREVAAYPTATADPLHIIGTAGAGLGVAPITAAAGVIADNLTKNADLLRSAFRVSK